VSDKQRFQPFEKAEGTSFKARLGKNNEYFKISIPPYVVDKERLQVGDSIRFTVEEIRRKTK